jgi:hypothetical protein
MNLGTLQEQTTGHQCYILRKDTSTAVDVCRLLSRSLHMHKGDVSKVLTGLHNFQSISKPEWSSFLKESVSHAKVPKKAEVINQVVEQWIKEGSCSDSNQYVALGDLKKGNYICMGEQLPRVTADPVSMWSCSYSNGRWKQRICHGSVDIPTRCLQFFFLQALCHHRLAPH